MELDGIDAEAREEALNTDIPNAHLEYARRWFDEKVREIGADATASPLYVQGGITIADFLDPLLGGVPLRENWRVLDIGCGGARLLEHVARLVPRGEAIGYDISAEMLGAAEERLAKWGGSYRLILGDGMHISPETGPVDFVYSTLTFQHNPGLVWMSLLRDAAVATRSGGWLRAQFMDNPEVTGPPRLAYSIDPAHARAAVEEAGWSCVQTEPWKRESALFWLTARIP